MQVVPFRLGPIIRVPAHLISTRDSVELFYTCYQSQAEVRLKQKLPYNEIIETFLVCDSCRPFFWPLNQKHLMKDFRKFLLLPGIIFLLANCDERDGNLSKNRFRVADYSAIHIGGNAVVEMRPGTPGGKTISIEGNSSLVSQFKVEVQSGVLYIRATERVNFEDRVRVIAPVSTLHS